MGSAEPNGELSVFEEGAGRVDVAAADTSSVTASPVSLSIGTVQWPHDDEQPVAKTVTYTNTGAEPVTLDLAADVTGPDGSAAPQGMFTLEPADLPLLALRFAPDLDDHNAAPAGRRFTIPMFVDRNSEGEAGRVNTPTVEVSYDDGATWRPATVRHDKVTVDHPVSGEFVSLRSSVADPDGYAQRLTIIRAYALR